MWRPRSRRRWRSEDICVGRCERAGDKVRGSLDSGVMPQYQMDCQWDQDLKKSYVIEHCHFLNFITLREFQNTKQIQNTKKTYAMLFCSYPLVY